METQTTENLYRPADDKKHNTGVSAYRSHDRVM